METEKPDFMFADSLLAALMTMAVIPGLSYDQARGRWRVEYNHRFLGYFPATADGTRQAIAAIEEARDAR